MKLVLAFSLFVLSAGCNSGKSKQDQPIIASDSTMKKDTNEQRLPALFEAIKNDTLIAGDHQTSYIQSISKVNGQLFIDADYMEFLVGDEGFEAAGKNHDLDTSYDENGKMTVGLLNDYYILNANTRIRKLPLYDKIIIEVFHWGEDTYYHERISADSLYKRFISDDHNPYEHTPFALTLRNGQVVKISEIYIP
jgi:hypothetical protein